MEYVYLIMKVLGGLGAFLLGMNLLSDNMSRLAHGKLRHMLNKAGKSRFLGVGIGCGVTMIAQSSSLTTVMVVGLVNAGIMTLFQATAIIMGANIGTTITAQIVALNSFDVATFALSLATIGVFINMFTKKEKIKTVGSALAGLGLIFVGLEFMSSALSLDPNSQIYRTITNILATDLNPIVLLLIGAVLTAVIQSSSAVTAIVITMASAGLVIGGVGDGVYFVVIGSNIGTCVTALLSSIGASPNARRAAIIHLMFNVFGSVIFAAFLLFWSISGTTFSEVVLQKLFPGHIETQIAMFHTFFNVVATCLFLPFIKLFVKLANLLVKDKKVEEKEEQKEVIELDERLLRQPSVALSRLYEDTGKVMEHAMGTMDIAFTAFLDKDVSAKEKVAERNVALARTNKGMIEYLIKVSASSLVLDEEKTVSSLHYVLNDIIRIGELADNVTKYTNHYVNDELVFSGEVIEMLKGMYGKITELSCLSKEIFLTKDLSRMQELDALEDRIDKDRRRLVRTHIERLNEGKCQPQNSSVFINLVGNLERAADHITYVAHSVEQAE